MGLSAGLIFDTSYHYIDHIAPFCALQKWPLIVFDSALASYCKNYYPDLELLEKEALFSVKTLVSCYPSKWLLLFFPELEKKKLLWLPHGNSDKGFKLSSFDGLEKETALIYGEMMRERVKIPHVRIGNFRLHYWKEHDQFYERMCQELLFSKEGKTNNNKESKMLDPKTRPTIYLYAPTWKDPEGNGSFPEMLEPLIKALPENAFLWIKLHPHSEKKEKELIDNLKKKWRKKENLFFLPFFAPIYPLLNLCDALIGDISSIAYDFLYFDRPLFLFPKKEKLPLDEAAEMIDPCDLKKIFITKDSKSLARKKIYEKTFDPYAPYRK